VSEKQNPAVPSGSHPETRGVLTDVIVPATTAAANLTAVAVGIKALKQSKDK
jgi:hypothetical protein